VPSASGPACPRPARSGSAGPDDWLPWRRAAERALYGEGGGALPPGFYRREAPGAHFRTAVHASPQFAAAVARLLCRVDEALGRPPELALLDVGSGRGELLTAVLAELPGEVAARVRAHGVDLAGRPHGLDPRIAWSAELPPRASASGLLFANEWLDNVPLDVVAAVPDGTLRTVLVRPADGAERLGGPPAPEDAAWLDRWWPLDAPQDRAADEQVPGERGPDEQDAAGPELRAEVGRSRDEAWAAAVRTLKRGLAVAVDYAHTRGSRPPFGTLTGYREGREVAPVPDGGCDLTAHVALDACAEAGHAAAREAVRKGPAARSTRPEAWRPRLVSQRAALRSLGVRGDRPPLSLASSEPARYVRELSAAGEAAELTDPGGLGAFTWLLQPVGVPPPLPR